MKQYLLVVLMLVAFFSQVQLAGQSEGISAELKKSQLENVKVRHGFLVLGHYSYQFPAADMAKRFGNNSIIGPGLWYKTPKNILIGAQGGFLFGNIVKEPDFLNNLLFSNGTISGLDGLDADIVLGQRGGSAAFNIGGIIALNKKNKDSGILLMGGLGFLQHKILIDDRNNAVPQFNDTYIKGYDRLTNGFSVSQFIGYLFLDKKKRINFFAGIELTQAFTQNQRTINFDTGLSETELRKDLFFGIKVGWILPVYTSDKDEFYIN